jgi:HEAT repeat protein
LPGAIRQADEIRILEVMKKALAPALLFLAAAILFFLPNPPRAPESVPPPPAVGNRNPVPPPADSDSVAPAIPRDRETARTWAAEWRRKAREDSGFRARLRQLVLDAAAASEARELAALVLGTLPGRDGLDVLAEALDAARDPRWIRTLLLALGSDRSSGEDDDIFDLPDSPRVHNAPLGLAITIRGAIDDPALRDGMIPRIRAGEDPGVRWAAALALSDSTSHSDVRRAFLEALPGERDPAAEGELAKALADWAAVETAESTERAQVFSALLDGAARDDAGALRLRSEDGLKRMSWTGAEVRTLAVRIESGSFDQRRWAIAVLAGAASRQETPERDFVFDSLARVSGSAPEAKVREMAVSGISAFSDQARASELLRSSLGDSAWHVRAAAVRGLGRVGVTPETLAALKKTELEDPDERVRRAAAEVRRALSSK